jgi:hypothetical protein
MALRRALTGFSAFLVSHHTIPKSLSLWLCGRLAIVKNAIEITARSRRN